MSVYYTQGRSAPAASDTGTLGAALRSFCGDIPCRTEGKVLEHCLVRSRLEVTRIKKKLRNRRWYRTKNEVEGGQKSIRI